MGLDTFDINSSVEVVKDVMTSTVKDFYFTAGGRVGTVERILFLDVDSYNSYCPRMFCNVQELKRMICVNQSPQLPFFEVFNSLEECSLIEKDIKQVICYHNQCKCAEGIAKYWSC